MKPACEGEGDDALYEGVVECCEDVFAYTEGIQLPQKVLSLLAFFKNLIGVVVKLQLVIEYCTQVLVPLHYFHWFPVNGGDFSLSQLPLSFREGHYHLLGFCHIQLQT